MSFVASTLFCDILTYNFCGGVLTDGVDIISFRPELTTPQHPLDLWVLVEDLTCSDALDDLYEAFGGCCGDGLYEKVGMVTVGADLDEVYVIALLYFKTGFSQCSDDTVGQYFPSILYRTYDVIEQTRDVVALA